MAVTIKQHDSEKLSRETRGHGAEFWEVYDNGQHVGTYPTEAEALRYKDVLESRVLETLVAKKR